MKPLMTTALLATAIGALALAPPASSEGDRMPKIKILGPQGQLNFEVRPRGACESFAAVPVEIRFRGQGVKRTFELPEPCEEWTSGATKKAPSVSFAPEDGTSSRAGRLRLKATGDAEAKRSYRFEIFIDGERKERGTMKVQVRKDDEGMLQRYIFVDD